MMELEDPNLFRKVRRDIARLETVKKERELVAIESDHIAEGS